MTRSGSRLASIPEPGCNEVRGSDCRWAKAHGRQKDSGVLAVLFLVLIRSIEAHHTHNLPFG